MRVSFKVFALAVPLFGWGTQAFGISDSGAQGLPNRIGATDIFSATCASEDTDHLAFSLLDATPVPDIEKQLLNAHLAKDALPTVDETSVFAGDIRTLSIAGGNGYYNLTVDTTGTNVAITRVQRFKWTFQCVNAGNEPTRTSIKAKSGRLRNSRQVRFRVRCLKHRTAGDTASLNATFSNLTLPVRSNQILNAQVFKRFVGSNATDRNGDQNYSTEISVKDGAGQYFIQVDQTGVDSTKDNSKDYSFKATCLNQAGVETADPVIQKLQNIENIGN